MKWNQILLIASRLVIDPINSEKSKTSPTKHNCIGIDILLYHRLREKRVEYKKQLKKVGLTNIPMEERWSLEDEELLEKIADETRRGFIFASIKNP
jgi:hypothetical protein